MRSLRIVISVLPLNSHLIPLIPVAAALRRLGHHVRIAAPFKLADSVTGGYGLRHVTAGRDWPDDPHAADRVSAALARSNDAFLRLVLAEFIAGDGPLLTARDILSLDPRPGVIFSDCAEFGGRWAAELLGVPWVRWDNGLTWILEEYAPTIAPRLARHREALRLSPHTPTGAEPIFTPAPVDLLFSGFDLPFQSYRHEPATRIGERLPSWMLDLPPDLALVYVSLGSILPNALGMSALVTHRYERILTALTQVDCVAVVAAGRTNYRLLSAPPNVRIVPYAPQSLMLRAADAHLTHCGYSSIRESIDSRVPMIAWPISTDQFHNAARCADHGLAITLSPDASVDEIRNALVRVLQVRQYRNSIRWWQRRMLGEPSLDHFLPGLLERITA